MAYQPINADSDEDHSQSLLLQPGGRYELLSTNRLALGDSYASSSMPSSPSSPSRSPSRSGERKKAKYCDVKTVAFFGVGIITLLYCILELGIGGWLGSLALLADGFHNLSDVVSLGIANWANQATKRPSTYDMSFGWARSEILGGLINAVFLLALCLYTSLEAIFEFIEPKPIDASWLYMGTAALGVIINTAGTLIFMATGNAHGHSHGGHGHSHGGDDHGHGHGHGGSKKKEKHGHGHGDKKKEKHGHGHGDKKKEKHGHGHGHGDKKKEKHGHGHGHGDKKKKEKHGHGHGHGEDDGHGEKKVRRDENVYAVFIHYLGDMISSLLVLCAGILIHFFGGNGPNVCSVTCAYLPNGGETWTLYLDPLTSLIIVGLIFVTSYPIVTRCVWILLQKAPDDMNIPGVRQEILMIDGVVSVHDLHIWQLVDGMVFCSAHIAVQEGISWIYISTAIRRVLHEHGVHSSSIQPEFIIGGTGASDFCEQNCVDDCAEDWCCKTPAESFKETNLSEINYEDDGPTHSGHGHAHEDHDGHGHSHGH